MSVCMFRSEICVSSADMCRYVSMYVCLGGRFVFPMQICEDMYVLGGRIVLSLQICADMYVCSSAAESNH